MKKRRLNIFEEIAQRNQTTPTEVRREIEKVMEDLKNSEEISAKNLLANIERTYGEVTAENLIAMLSSMTKNRL